jgi:hypothetical protein
LNFLLTGVIFIAGFNSRGCKMKKIAITLLFAFLFLLNIPVLAEEGKVYSDTDLKKYKSSSDDEYTVQSDKQGNDNKRSNDKHRGCIVLNYSSYDKTEAMYMPGRINTRTLDGHTTGTVSGGGTTEWTTATCMSINIKNTDYLILK